MRPACPACGSGRTRTSGRPLRRLLRRLTGRPRYRCRDCGLRWAPGEGPGLRHRGFFRRHPNLTAGLAALALLGAGYLLLGLLGMLPAGINWLRTEKFFTGSSGKKYTIGGAIDRAIEKSREGD